MRIYSNTYELMSETARNIWEMGSEVKPKHYQNKNIEGKEEFITKELICEQYCLTSMDNTDPLFAFTKCKDWADAELQERLRPSVNPGEAWKLRKDIWEEFLVQGKFDYSYSERINDRVSYKGKRESKLDSVISLLKEDPDTRKAIIGIFGASYLEEQFDQNFLDGSCRIPCSMYYNLLIRTNARGEKQLNICYHQRSSDFVTHFGNDVYLAWGLMEHIARELQIKPGYLYHTIDSLHSYKRDWEKLKTSISTELK